MTPRYRITFEKGDGKTFAYLERETERRERRWFVERRVLRWMVVGVYRCDNMNLSFDRFFNGNGTLSLNVSGTDWGSDAAMMS